MRDGVIRKMIDKWLQAKVLEDGQLQADNGRHAAGRGDLAAIGERLPAPRCWTGGGVEQVQPPRMRGPARLIRYADDFVMVFATESDARRVMEVLPKRFAGSYGLALHPEARIGEDATDRIWPDPGAEERRGRRKTADLRLPREYHPLLGKVTQGNAGG